jgi:hypothetical protein
LGRLSEVKQAREAQSLAILEQIVAVACLLIPGGAVLAAKDLIFARLEAGSQALGPNGTT